MGQLAQLWGVNIKGSISSNTEVNPREHCNAIHVWGGKENEESENVDIGVTSESCTTRVSMHDQVVCVAEPTIQIEENDENDAKTNLNNQFAKFVGMFKKLHINIPFAEAMKHMPNYAKFLGEAMSNKNKWAENGMVNLTEECSALIQRKIPQKLKDPGSFTIPCTIGDIFFDNVLCDLRSSINLMPLSVLRKLGLVEVRPSTVTLQLADRSLVHPTGILENVLIKVDKFIFPVDFLVLDMNEDCDTPLILGRPFLATAEALIDVKKGEHFPFFGM
ncbi:hypothetical protein DH2020_020312 [Rehmannia glutinosa]|uniref:Uncharacterized protein n=1 Tax=Rehmannia glutinosa TaxID=99300 RepID=A0ABR0WFX9_REHGL